MSNTESIYLTTPIYYVNDVPHIGHSYTTIMTDILSRYYRLLGNDVFYLTGTDEHGQKIEKAAEAKNMTPQQLVDSVVMRFKDLWEKFGIGYDHFIRTTDEDHKRVVRDTFKKIYESGYIYLGKYEGLYCRPCETYFTDTQAPEGVCPDCGRELVLLKEDAYFFKLSAFEKPLLDHISQHEDFVLPTTRKNEVVSFIEQGLTDLCISRTTISWGIEVPNIGLDLPDKHYVYVWFDALLNYLSGIGYLRDDETFNRYWPAFAHMIGKDILKFHAVIWPAMLMALGLDLPKHIFGHGFIYQDGEKMSKSKGNVLDPYVIMEDYGVDPFRYYLSREIVFGLDGTYSEEKMLQRYNSDLANDYGNLLNRTLNMMKKYFDLTIPSLSDTNLSNEERVLEKDIEELYDKVVENMNQFKTSIALEAIFSVIRRANKYIEDMAPWSLKKEQQSERLAMVMVQILETLRIISIWLSPFMPETTSKALAQLNAETTNQEGNPFAWGYFKGGMTLNEPEPLFPRR